MNDMEPAARLIVEVAALQRGVNEETTGHIDATNLLEEEIESLISKIVTHAQAAGISLRGVRAGGDIFERLGGSNGPFSNARALAGLYVVQSDNLGRLEFVFQP